MKGNPLTYQNRLLFIFLLVVIAHITQAQDCSDLLRQGLREYTKVITSSENYQQTQSAICEAYQEYKSNNNVAKANAKYQLVFKGNANYSSEQIEQIGKLYCEQNFSLSMNGQYGEYQGSFIDPNFTQMYLACINASSKNIQLKLEPTDNRNESIVITASYLSHSLWRPKVTSINYDTSLLKVEGELKNAALAKTDLNGFYSLRATRNDLSNTVPFHVANELVLAKAHQMTLQFENASITINFPAIYPNPPKIELKKGVGEIVASMLPENKFIDLYGKDWALANGEKTPSWAAYKIISDTLPDLRGVFLRGKNYDRPLSKGNPNGDLKLGTYSDDMFENHTHAIQISQKTDNFNRAILYRSEQNVPNKTVESQGSATGGIETRPKNITVNYFIKIN
jgi:hypothetical protein